MGGFSDWRQEGGTGRGGQHLDMSLYSCQKGLREMVDRRLPGDERGGLKGNATFVKVYMMSAALNGHLSGLKRTLATHAGREVVNGWWREETCGPRLETVTRRAMTTGS
ncbi:hypothetical protein DPEC_G00345430 [Dallia pectoralis]|uniref:Uncharacterized protein n=1 Tax=Dallia pectoralis TaxID=75939 RepID=A0ACC2F3K4_DALPE|nr:hypothetical protein DPEC_G00345430 [Dallia pectoralis]